MGIDYKFDLMLSEDGSGRGAALVAAVLKREETQQWPAVDGHPVAFFLDDDEVFINSATSWKEDIF